MTESDFFLDDPDFATVEKSTEGQCDDCHEEFQVLVRIQEAENGSMDPEDRYMLGKRCENCMVKLFPLFEDEIRGTLGALNDAFNNHMTSDEFEELYGEE